jgi:predicted metal-dependent hydrolase
MPSNIEYEVRYRKIRYPRLEFKTGKLVLVLPLGYKDEALLLKRHERWINSRIAMINEALEESKNLTLVMRTKEEFHYVIKKLLHKYEKLLGKKINKIYFRRMRSKWASYSTKNNITINTMMQYLPDELLSYVVFHELLHTEIRKHNANFWRNIERRFSNHDELEMQLFYYWFLLQKEMTQSQMNKI